MSLRGTPTAVVSLPLWSALVGRDRVDVVGGARSCGVLARSGDAFGDLSHRSAGRARVGPCTLETDGSVTVRSMLRFGVTVTTVVTRILLR